MKDIIFLSQKSEPATRADNQVVQDLLDTLKANEAHGVGMAANMIGVKKQIIAVNMGMFNVAMINPVVTMKSGSYQTEEGCLSLVGMRPATRYKEIEVEYFDAMWKKQKQKYSGMIAQRIQHEIDHLSGIII
jgi:peptide deformylase